MRKMILLTMLATLFAAIIAAAARNTAASGSKKAQSRGKQARLGAEFSLAAGQRATFKSDKLVVEFVAVTEDSRCPPGVACIWAGNARVQIKISKGNRAPRVFELNTNLEAKSVDYQGYTIELVTLTPAAAAGAETDAKNVKYAATLIVRR